jgi:hypothetical protein
MNLRTQYKRGKWLRYGTSLTILIAAVLLGLYALINWLVRPYDHTTDWRAHEPTK